MTPTETKILVEMSQNLNEISNVLKDIHKLMVNEDKQILKESTGDVSVKSKMIPEDRKDPALVVKKILAS